MPYIAHTILNVSDYQKSKEFYDKLAESLGIETRQVSDSEDCPIRAYEIPGCPLYVRCDRSEVKKKFVRSVGLDHICIGVESKELVDSCFEVVKELGVKITSEPRKYPDYTDNYYAFYFRDPDGIPLEIAYI